MLFFYLRCKYTFLPTCQPKLPSWKKIKVQTFLTAHFSGIVFINIMIIVIMQNWYANAGYSIFEPSYNVQVVN